MSKFRAWFLFPCFLSCMFLGLTLYIHTHAWAQEDACVQARPPPPTHWHPKRNYSNIFHLLYLSRVRGLPNSHIYPLHTPFESRSVHDQMMSRVFSTQRYPGVDLLSIFYVFRRSNLVSHGSRIEDQEDNEEREQSWLCAQYVCVSLCSIRLCELWSILSFK
jgi:hypothetical protein